MSGRTLRLAADDAGVARAAALLRAGELVAFPTETVYGLGGDATDAAAVAAIYAAKNRPSFNPLIAHYATPAAAFGDVTPTAAAERLAAAFWPGPLTLVLPRRPHAAVARLAGAGLDTQAVRVPAHPIAHRLLAAVGRPIAAPSANLSGRVSPTTAQHVLDGLDGRVAAVIDGGACAVGLESTVVDLSAAGPVLLRAGGVTLEALRCVVPDIAAADDQDAAAPRSPGRLLTHYAPDLPVRLDATEITETEALLAFGPALPGAGLLFNLSDAGDLAEAAARLFAGLRWLDSQGRARGLRGIAVMAVPQSGLGVAINDRLHRAASRS
jgi:L-threonylcarbamoyladenylate synthase